MHRDMVGLVVLAALWGGSFLFMRVAVPELGAVPLIALRLALAAETGETGREAIFSQCLLAVAVK